MLVRPGTLTMEQIGANNVECVICFWSDAYPDTSQATSILFVRFIFLASYSKDPGWTVFSGGLIQGRCAIPIIPFQHQSASYYDELLAVVSIERNPVFPAQATQTGRLKIAERAVPAGGLTIDVLAIVNVSCCNSDLCWIA